MGLETKMTQELLDEILSRIFPKKDILDKPTPIIRYDRKFLEELRPTPKSNLVPPFPSTFKSLNARNYPGNKIEGPREGINCHFCGEKGHIKKSCVRKQTFDNTRRNRFNNPTIHLNNPVHTQIPISFDLEFLESTRGLTQLQNLQITLDELIRIRTIVNTFIHFYPTQNKPRGNSSNLY